MAETLEARDLEWAHNTPELMEQHLMVTKGKTRTRFPPEPNGYLHIGHAKSLHMNFKLAFEKLGIAPENRETIFRYDDTNPDAESHEYIESIAEDVAWMGWTPTRTTFSSDYFDQLHEFAVALILKGKAYVCHQTSVEIKRSRELLALRRIEEAKHPEVKCNSCNDDVNISPWRNRRSNEENLRLFEDMRKGKVDSSFATLRLKMDLDSSNPNMWDTVAYRIKYTPHPHAGDKWCIYPSYDFTHCIVDSLEHIDYSICTLEFETRRESYYWLLKELDLYRPNVYEFSRLSLTNTIMSKRKLLALVRSGSVRGWDDPRLPTIRGVRRRGFTSSSINDFCVDVGVTRSDGTVIAVDRLNNAIRTHLHEVAPRAMAVKDPVKLILHGLGVNVILAPDFPHLVVKPSSSSAAVNNDDDGGHRSRVRSMAISNEVYVDAGDVNVIDDGDEDEVDFYGIKISSSSSSILPCRVGLRFAFVVDVISVDWKPSSSGCRRSVSDVEAIHVSIAPGVEKWPKGVLTWVDVNSSVEFELRWYNDLFIKKDLTSDIVKHDDDDDEDDGTHLKRSVANHAYEYEFNPRSEVVYHHARLEGSVVATMDHYYHYHHGTSDYGRYSGQIHLQLERIGYVCLDYDTTGELMVFNSTIQLKEGNDNDKKKKKKADVVKGKKQQPAAVDNDDDVSPRDYLRRRLDLATVGDDGFMETSLKAVTEMKMGTGRSDAASADDDYMVLFPVRDAEGKEVSKKMKKKLAGDLIKYKSDYDRRNSNN